MSLKLWARKLVSMPVTICGFRSWAQQLTALSLTICLCGMLTTIMFNLSQTTINIPLVAGLSLQSSSSTMDNTRRSVVLLSTKIGIPERKSKLR